MKNILHIISNQAISGPNTSSALIINSYLNKKYNFYQFVFSNNFIQLIKTLSNIRPSIIHLNGLQMSAFKLIIIIKLYSKCKVVLTVRGTTEDALKFNFFKKIIVVYIFEPITLFLSDTVYTVCDFLTRKKRISFFSNKFLGTIHNSAPKVPLYIDRKNFKNKNLKIVIFGRMVYDKGIKDIIKAILVLSNKNFIFTFIGHGPMINEIKDVLSKEITNKKVKLIHEHNEILKILPQYDIFLFATLHENLSNALLEACSCGLVPIVTNVGGNTEVITDKENGLLINPNDSSSIISAINFLDNNRNKMSKISEAAIKCMRERFSQDNLLIKIDKIYSNT